MLVIDGEVGDEDDDAAAFIVMMLSHQKWLVMNNHNI